jgi:hypothetical protein
MYRDQPRSRHGPAGIVRTIVTAIETVRDIDQLVRLVRWPADAELLSDARRAGVPRLILVDPGVSPPVGADAFEDWIRLPASDDDIDARMNVLADRALSVPPTPRPTLDAEGVLRYGDRVVPLSPIASVLVGALIDRYQRVVPREVLAQAVWPTDDPKLNALDVHMVRLRRQVSRVGLTVRTVRQRGYLLDVDHSR